MNVEDVIRERIEAARRKAEREKQQRAELAAARAAGLARRHAQKLYRLAHAPTQNEDFTMPAAIRTAICPACRQQRPVRVVSTAVVAGAPYNVLRCSDDSCELLWLVRAERPRTAPAAAA